MADGKLWHRRKDVNIAFILKCAILYSWQHFGNKKTVSQKNATKQREKT